MDGSTISNMVRNGWDKVLQDRLVILRNAIIVISECNWIINDLRLNPQLLSEVQLDETDEQLLFDMMWETKKYLNQNSALISEIVHRLK